MSETKHTSDKLTYAPSGPWDGFDGWWILDGKRVSVATVDGPQNDETEARARRFSAAADMLEALQDVESKIIDFVAGRINWRPDDFLMRVREAIAKAEGRS